MLIYHPAYDANHGMFRMLRLLTVNPDQAMKWDSFRILDIYYLFPHLLLDARLPPKLTKAKKAAAAGSAKYNHAPSPKIFIQQIAGLHESIAMSLASKGFISESAFKAGLLQRTSKSLPVTVEAAFDDAADDDALVRLLAVDLAALPLSGQNGLKERTGLLEHYYDPV